MKTPASQQSVIIIGAGAAGLMAAREISPGYTVTVLEAGKVAGGRIKTDHSREFATILECGAEFVHGKLPVTFKLLREGNIAYHKTEGKMLQVSGGKWKTGDEMMDGWEELLHRMSKLEADTTMAAFLDKFYSRKKHLAFKQQVIRYVNGFDLADINQVSVQSLYNEWSHEEDKNFRIDQGYGALIDFLVKECTNNKCTFHMNTVVSKVTWEKDLVTVETGDNKIYTANKLIITVPISILQQTSAKNAIVFHPALEEYHTAAGNIGFGNVIKIILQFKTPFWEAHHQHIGFIISDELIPTWWSQQPDNAPVLTGWLGGPPAGILSGETDDHIVQLALQSLSAIFHTAVAELQSALVKSKVSNWAKEEGALGAYSYSTPSSAAARKKLGTPVKNTVYFAGEALYEGASPGTVEAALSNGRKVARKLLRQKKSIKK